MLYVHVPAQNRRKMDRKAVVVYLVGYNGDEQYRIWVLERRDDIVSHDIIFYKTVRNCNDKIEWPVKLEKITDIQEGQNDEEKATNESNTVKDTN